MTNLAKTRKRSRACERNACSEVSAFIESLVARHLDESTVRRYAYGIDRFCAYLRRRRIHDLRKVVRRHVLDYRTTFLTTRLSPCTVQGRIRSVRCFFEWLEESGKILLNPAVDIPMPKLVPPLPRTVLTRSEIKKLLDAPDITQPVASRDKAILELLYSTGIRLGELCRLTVRDVDVSGGYLRIEKGKGGKGRMVPLGYKARDCINEYLRRVRPVFTRRNPDERALFVNRRGGGRMSPKSVNLLVHSYAKSGGLGRDASPHVLRHSCATHMLANKANIVDVQKLLGHSLLGTTQVYTRVAQPELKDTYKRTHPRERDDQ